jgi:malate dehydrogenase (oxaloacetate-decarboxylating)
MGIAHLLVDGVVLEGFDRKDGESQIYVIDRKGLVHENHTSPTGEPLAIDPFIKGFEETKSWKVKDQNEISFLETISEVKPTLLIGVCAQSKIFSEEIIKEMARHVEHPIIFPLSNPTSKAEADPKDIIEWTKGKAIVATGSPFAPFSYEQKLYTISQANNVYIFPGLGLGAVAVAAKKITNEMFLIAAKTLGEETISLRKNTSQLYPSFAELRDVSKKIAINVGEYARAHHLATNSQESVESLVEKMMWYPHYPSYLRADSK